MKLGFFELLAALWEMTSLSDTVGCGLHCSALMRVYVSRTCQREIGQKISRLERALMTALQQAVTAGQAAREHYHLYSRLYICYIISICLHCFCCWILQLFSANHISDGFCFQQRYKI